MNVSAASRIVSAISFGVFWRARLRPAQSSGRESRAPLSSRDTDDDAIAKHARAAGNRAAVAAALANHRRGFAGDRRFIHTGDSFDDIAVGRDDVARFADHEVAFLQDRARELFPRGRSAGDAPSFPCAPAQTGCLRFASPFRDCLSEIGEEHGEPEPDRQLRDETAQSRFSGKDSNSR